MHCTKLLCRVSLLTYESEGKDIVILVGDHQLHTHPRFYDHDAIGKFPDAAF